MNSKINLKDCPHNFRNPKWIEKENRLACRDCGEDITFFIICLWEAGYYEGNKGVIKAD